MPETPPQGLPLKIPAGQGRKAARAKYGLTSWVNSKRLPQGKGFQAVRRELSRLREALIHEHGGEKITPDAAILVDSVIEALGVQKLLGLYVRKYGVLDARAVKRGQLELSPVLSRNWIAYQNSVRQGILALRELDRCQAPERAMTIMEIAAEIDGEEEERQRRAAEAGQEGPGLASAGRTPVGADEGKGWKRGKSGGAADPGEKEASRFAQEGRTPEGEGPGPGPDGPEEEGR